MTVWELIKELESYPKDKKVVIYKEHDYWMNWMHWDYELVLWCSNLWDEIEIETENVY